MRGRSMSSSSNADLGVERIVAAAVFHHGLVISIPAPGRAGQLKAVRPKTDPQDTLFSEDVW